MADLKKGVTSLFIILIISALTAYGQKNYYLSSFRGSDANSGVSSDSPWKSIDKLESILPQLGAGDAVYFERGSIWHEVEIALLNKKGTQSSPIKFEAFGTGARPVLSGGKLIDNFNQDGNIYSATIYKDFNHKYIIVPSGILINGKWQDIGRSPEYFTTGNNSSSYFSDDKQNWTSGQLAGSFALIQSRQWQWNPAKITSNTSNSINFNEIEFCFRQ